MLFQCKRHSVTSRPEAVNYRVKHLRVVHKTAQSLTFSLTKNLTIFSNGSAPFPPHPNPTPTKVESPGIPSE